MFVVLHIDADAQPALVLRQPDFRRIVLRAFPESIPFRRITLEEVVHLSRLFENEVRRAFRVIRRDYDSALFGVRVFCAKPPNVDGRERGAFKHKRRRFERDR